MGKQFMGCDFSESWGQICNCEQCETAEKRQIEYELNRGWHGYLDLTNIAKMPETIQDVTLLQYVIQKCNHTYLQNNKHLLRNILRQYSSMVNEPFLFITTNKCLTPIEYAELTDTNWLVEFLLDYPALMFDHEFFIKLCVNPKIKIGTICKLICHEYFEKAIECDSSPSVDFFNVLKSKYDFFEINTFNSITSSETRRKKIINKLTKVSILPN